MTPKSSQFDLESSKDDIPLVIEITRMTPSEKDNTHNFKHQAIGGNVRAHIFDTYRFCVNNLLARREVYGFVIINDKWRSFEHINELIRDTEKFNCFILFTNFDKTWEKKIAEKINEITKNEKI